MNKPIDQILVALDLSKLDEKLIQYAAYIAEINKTKKVYFIHNIKQYLIGDLFEKQLEKIDLEEIIEEKLTKSIKKNFNSDVEWEFLISEDVYSDILIKYTANKYQIDLVIVGNKNSYKGSGAITGKLLRILKTDILSIPENATFPIKKGLVTTDFSSAANKALDKALELNDKISLNLCLLNVFKLPQLYFPYLNIEKSIKKVEIHIEKQFNKLSKNYDNYSSEKLSAGDVSIPEKIASYAEKNKFDILFISSKGHNSYTSLLIGSVTEELFTHNLNIPLWVVKN